MAVLASEETDESEAEAADEADASDADAAERATLYRDEAALRTLSAGDWLVAPATELALRNTSLRFAEAADTALLYWSDAAERRLWCAGVAVP
jgi:hypothetical protein